ncbi:MAG: threonine/serine dehydratase [Chloroflexi bacterium]|nr:threonine/serine dehydratase [Chloroflexota bacterium]
MIELRDIYAARLRLRKQLPATPLRYSHLLSQLTSTRLFLKLENFNPTGSFKVRGAYNMIGANLAEARRRGIVTASAGNHGLGTAWAASRLGGVPATIFLPHSAPQAKVSKFGEFAVNVRFAGETYDDAHHAADAHAAETGALYIGAYADPEVAAGQGTIALELLEALPETAAIVVPVGGGGMISGITVAARSINPRIQIVGVQPDASPALTASLRDGICHEEYSAGPTICDGLAGGVGTLAYELARSGAIDRVINVSEDQVHEAVYTFLSQEQLVIEGSGAVGLAALMSGQVPELRGQTVVLVLSGGNIDMCILQSISARFGNHA